MFKPFLFLSIFISFCVIKASAQTDTSSYDLGRVSVKKGFTQTITIKGSDLERYQFSDLADAINVWLYGTYSNAQSLVYVVEGNIVTDVNAYSIYDVDEITLIQSALAQVSGAAPGQQLVLIKLKTNRPGKQGIEAAGQTSLVNIANRQNTPNMKSTTDIYDQYYLSGYKNYQNVQFGVSADFQRDVMPLLSSSSFNSVDPFHFDRFKLNGYANGRLWKGTTLNFGINYVPQASSYGEDYSISNNSGNAENNSLNGKIMQHMASSNIAINSVIAKGLTNSLSGAYSHYNYFEGDSINAVLTTTGYPTETIHSFFGGYNKTTNLLLRDNLVYHANLGPFLIEPAVNFSFRKFNDAIIDSSKYLEFSSEGGIPSYNFNEEGYGAALKLYLLTPSVNITYKDAINLQGGFTSLLNSKKDFNPIYPLPREFPFLAASIDAFKLMNVKNMTLQLYGSFSRQNTLLDDPYASLDAFGLASTVNSNNSFQVVGLSSSSADIIFPSSDYQPFKQYNNYQGGLAWGVAKNFNFNYNYENKYSASLVAVEIEDPPFVEIDYVNYYTKEITNRAGVSYIFNINGLNWRTGLNIAQEKLSVNDPHFTAQYAAYLSDGHRYSGGFTNRLAYQSFFAGLDILYQLGQRPITLDDTSPNALASPPHVNSVALQSLYLGSQIRVNKTKYAEVFLNTRNILQNNSSVITDNRRFYGLGFKVDL